MEYLFQGPKQTDKTPIVLVHGAYNSAEVWSDNLMSFFAKKGHPVFAIQLKSSKDLKKISTLWRYSYEDYIQKIETLSTQLSKLAYYIGHSMGGLLLQTFASRRPERVLAIVLMASLPPFGLKNTFWSMLRHPVRLFIYVLLTLAPAIARKGQPP